MTKPFYIEYCLMTTKLKKLFWHNCYNQAKVYFTIKREIQVKGTIAFNLIF